MKRPEFWKNRNVLVTGSSGFLGSWLVKDLREAGANVIGLVRDQRQEQNTLGDPMSEPQSIAYGDLSSIARLRRVLAEYEVTCVFHLAAQPIVGTALRDPVGTFEANIAGTWNLLDASRQVGGIEQIVVASSDKAYGASDILPYTEDLPLNGTHPYDVSKSCTDLICRTYFETYDLPVCITRAGNFYGGGDLNYSRIVPGTIKLALDNMPPILRSDGTMIRDYIYVRDVADGYLTIAEQMHRKDVVGEAFNLSTESRHNVLELTKSILEACNRVDLEPMIQNTAKSEIPEQALDAGKARRVLGWESKYDLQSALRETVDWYAERLRLHTA